LMACATDVALEVGDCANPIRLADGWLKLSAQIAAIVEILVQCIAVLVLCFLFRNS
jgi:hypothetical protein